MKIAGFDVSIVLERREHEDEDDEDDDHGVFFTSFNECRVCRKSIEDPENAPTARDPTSGIGMVATAGGDDPVATFCSETHRNDFVDAVSGSFATDD